MMYRHEDRLFIAGNTDTLKYFDISDPDTMVVYKLKIEPVVPLPTNQTSFMKIHEVKGTTLANGRRLIGLGIPRGGMAIVEFDTYWSILSTQFQLYDAARPLFPKTVLNPNKTVYNNSYAPDSSRTINDKWDHRGCHSVIPYDQNGGRYVLTVDELNWFDGIQNKSRMWLPSWWERLDFFLSPDSVDAPTFSSCNDTGWYDHQPVFVNGSLYRICSECTLREPESHRLNFIHRNYPGRHATDPNKFQGAFVRIWNRDSLWHNDTTGANDRGLVVGAYDIQEEANNPVGYSGKDNIPDTSFVPSGLHEPILSGRRLYLAGYNSGARVLDVNGANLRLRGYCRMEDYLSNDTNSVNFYARPDIYMYAKGIYRLIPDLTTDDVLFGSDIYNGTWILKFYDSTITGTIAHNSFQPCVEIGTVDSTKRQTFSLSGTVTILDTSCVTFTDHTTFKSSCGASIADYGSLHIESVDFDTTGAFACADPFLIVRAGGSLELGDEGKTITGMRTIVIDSGGTATIKAGTTLNMANNAHIIVNGTLNIEASTYATKAHVRCQKGGVINIAANSTIDGIHTIDVEYGGGLTLGNRCVLRMADSGRITLSMCMSTSGVTDWARIDGVNQSPFGSWLGIAIDSLVDGNCTVSNLFVHNAVQEFRLCRATSRCRTASCPATTRAS
ncbi:MAG: hypothetical protein IPP94_04430 [Ignavibacteria bacterium]|nr:hypothetical protein [Ignavibacteria bacterium]